MVQGHRITAIIYAAAQLNLAEALGHDAKSAVELAPLVSADPDSLNRLLIALAALGICESDGERFRLTDVGGQLDSKAGPSVKDWVLFEGEFLARSWTDLVDSVRTGKNAFELREEGDDSFTVMGNSPRMVKVFNAAVASITGTVLPKIVAALDFSTAKVVMDVGGGSGELIGGILSAKPHLEGIVFDLARCEQEARSRFLRLGITGRCRFIAGDFFRSVPPGADTIVMKSIIHDWRDERATIILRNSCAALPVAGQLVLIERLMPERPTASALNREIASSDLNMLRWTGGRERKESEYCNLAESVGFHFVKTANAGFFNLIQFNKMAR